MQRQVFAVALCAAVAQGTTLTSSKAYRSGKWAKPPTPPPAPIPEPEPVQVAAVIAEDPYSTVSNG